jgi:hypothetical protein
MVGYSGIQVFRYSGIDKDAPVFDFAGLNT